VFALILTFLFDLPGAVDHESHFLAVFRRLCGDAFGRGFNVSHLRITRGFNLGHKLFLGQGIDTRRETNDCKQKERKDHLRDCFERSCSMVCNPNLQL
jgi:hypothetical protein